MFERIGLSEILVIGVIALIIFGPAKLPQLGRSIGEGIREFRGAIRSLHDEEPASTDKKG